MTDVNDDTASIVSQHESPPLHPQHPNLQKDAHFTDEGGSSKKFPEDDATAMAERRFTKLCLQRDLMRETVRTVAVETKSMMAQDNIPNLTVMSLRAQLTRMNLYSGKLNSLDDDLLDFQDREELNGDQRTIHELSMLVCDTMALGESLLMDLTNQRDHMSGHPSTNLPNPAPSVDGAASAFSASAGAKVKLPKLEIAQFNGDPLEWQGFWDHFESTIDLNADLSDIDKLKYLKKYLGREALASVDGFRLSNDNYSVVVSILKERFGNPETAKFAHFDQLIAIKSAEKDPSKLPAIYSECEKHIRCLVALGLDESTFEQVFTPMVLSKLPKSTRIQMHRDNGAKPWTLSTLRQLMKDEIQARARSDTVQDFGRTDEPSTSQGNGSRNDSSSNGNKNKSSKNGKKWSTQGATLSQASKTLKCCFCSGSHYSTDCTKYPTNAERRPALQSQNRCFKCLADNHLAAECKRNRPCFYCRNTGHHPCICPQQFGNGGQTKPKGGAHGKNVTTVASAPPSVPADDDETVQPTVMMMALVDFPEHNTSARILFDGGSTTSYVTTALAHRLNLDVKKNESFVYVQRFGSRKSTVNPRKLTVLPIPLPGGSVFNVKAHVLDVLTGSIPKFPLDPDKYPILNTLQLTDKLSKTVESVELDALVGGNYLHKLTTGERIQLDDGLYLYGSKLGYIPAGTVEGYAGNVQSDAVAMFTRSFNHEDLQAIDRFWSLEDIGITDNPHIDDNEQALDTFNSSVQFVDGRYQVALPWKDNASELPTNYGLSMGRLKSLLQRLTPEVLREYHSIICNQRHGNICEVVDVKKEASATHYLPHHCVIKPDSSTTKLRIVYDASAKANKSQPSLNEALHRGPSEMKDLCGLLLRFRTTAIAFVCDIEKAFHQVSVDPKDRDVLRFLWLKDINRPLTAGNIETLRFTRVIFGVICSPFLLDATIKHHLNLKDTQIGHQILRNIYVDNVLGGATSAAEAEAYYSEAKCLFDEISMNLREWFTNSPDFATSLKPEDRGDGKSCKVLGLHWDTISDRLNCNGPAGASACSTKRKILAEVASVFDPCGFFAPVTVRAKIVIQDLWRQNLSWDETVPNQVASQFDAIQQDLSRISGSEIDRKINQFISEPGAKHEIHVFCDASAKAYAAAVYIRSTSTSGQTSTGLVISKARLAKIEPMTIPRLELMAALIGARLAAFVRDELQFQNVNTTLWSDSKCVLHWLLSTKQLKVFVRNRIDQIKAIPNIRYRYVPTTCNPADIPSRGCTLDELTDCNMWWDGPQFLALPEHMWPENTFEVPAALTEAEVEVVSAQRTTMVQVEHEPVVPFDKFSSWNKALRVTAWVFQAVENFKSKRKSQSPDNPTLKRCNIAKAERYLVQEAQRPFKSAWLDSKSNVFKQLNLFDDNGIIRTKGRLELSDLQGEAKAPSVLPKNHPLTRLIIQQCHQNLNHAGTRQTLAQVRYDYWIINGGSETKRAIKACMACRKSTGGPFKVPPAPPIPEFRVTRAFPFERCGVDYFGPLLCKDPADPDSPMKVWVSLYTCGVTRAIHMDTVEDLSADQFLMSYRRFAAVYGKPSLMVSDNATNFKAVAKVMHQAYQEAQQANCSGTEWKFITELAPWMGGFYERLIGSVKQALRKTLGTKRLTLIQFRTVLAEVTETINSRPLTPVEHEPGEIALTPAHFLARRGRAGLPSLDSEPDFNVGTPTTPQVVLNLWKAGQKVLNEFWKCWRNEYLQSLRERPPINFHQRNTSAEAPTVGAVVQIKEDCPRNQWKIGVIVDVKTDGAGGCRSAAVRISSGKLLHRPIKLLYPLEICADPSHVRGPRKKKVQQQKTAATSRQKSTRRAAVQARDQLHAEALVSDSEDE